MRALHVIERKELSQGDFFSDRDIFVKKGKKGKANRKWSYRS